MPYKEVSKDTEIHECRDERWEIVARKPRYQKRRAIKPAKPKAIRVEKIGETSYADILKKIKSDPLLKEVGENVSKIRRTQKGDMLFELNRTATSRTQDYTEMIAKSLGNAANVKMLKQEMMVTIKDIDEVSTKQDIVNAISSQFSLEVKEEAIKWMRKGFGGMQIAGISLPIDQASTILLAGKIKIGWTSCLIKELQQPKRCYKCLEFNHSASACTNVDRSRRCWRCGENGHQAKTCRNDTKCLLCAELCKEGVDASRASLYRRAIVTRWK